MEESVMDNSSIKKLLFDALTEKKSTAAKCL